MGGGSVASSQIDRALDAHKQVDWNMTNHAPESQEVVGKFDRLRSSAKALGHLIANDCPESRERSLAMTNLEQALMWAVAAVARNQPGIVEDDEPQPIPPSAVTWPMAGEFIHGPIGPL